MTQRTNSVSCKTGEFRNRPEVNSRYATSEDVWTDGCGNQKIFKNKTRLEL